MADHPAWQELLNKIPEGLHEIVKPVFAEWDQGVQKALEAKTNELKQYEPYKQFVEYKVDPEWLAEAADFTRNFEQNPKVVIENANKAWNLGFNLDGSPAVQQNSGDNNNTLFEDDDEMPADITQHPQFAELMQVVNGLKENVDNFTSEQQASKQAEEFNNFLDQQQQNHQFDRDYVTALMANGSTFSQALDSYNTLIASVVGGGEGESDDSNDNNQAGSDNGGAPVVMGNGGSDGSGLPDQPVSFGNMKSSDLEDTVAQMIAAAQQQGS